MAKSDGKPAAARRPKNGRAIGNTTRRVETRNGTVAMTPNVSSFDDLLGKVFDEVFERVPKRGLRAAEYAELKHDFVFHMRDIKEDVEKIARLYHHPERRSPEAESVFIIGFLYHVIPHLRAASRILLGEEIRGAFETPSPIERKANRLQPKRFRQRIS
jgi:hypothetical protein